jgi:ankyrin repeat protein
MRDSILYGVCVYYTPEKLDLVKCLIENGADVNYEHTFYSKVSILYEVCFEYIPEKLDLVKCLIENGADVNFENDSYPKQSLLVSVCKEYTPEKLDLVKCLIENGADVCYEYDSYPKESLLVSMCKEYTADKLDLVRCLIENGANVNYEYGSYPAKSPLVIACEEYDSDKLDLVKCLIEHGADVKRNYNSWPSSEKTLLHLVCGDYTPEKLELIKFLLESGVNPNDRKIYKFAVLNFSPEKRDLLELLVEHNFTYFTNEICREFWHEPVIRHTLLNALRVIFAKCPDFDFVPRLVLNISRRRGDEDIEDSDEEEESPLLSWQKFVIKSLLSMSHIFEYEPVSYIFERIFDDIVLTRFIFKNIDISSLSTRRAGNFRNAIKSCMHERSYEMSREVILFFVEKGVNLNVRNDKGMSLLHMAAQDADDELIDLLCPLIDIDALDWRSHTAWDYLRPDSGHSYSDDEDADRSYNASFVAASRVFMKHRADPWAGYAGEVVEDLMIPNLARVLYEDTDDIVEYCYKNVDINRVLYDGNTIVHEAARRNNYCLLEYLLGMGARTDLKNDNGNLPLHIAMDECVDCTRLLLNAKDICVQGDQHDVLFCDDVGPYVARHIIGAAFRSDPTLFVLSQCAAALPYTERKRIRSILCTLNRTPIPKSLFANIIALSFD